MRQEHIAIAIHRRPICLKQLKVEVPEHIRNSEVHLCIGQVDTETGPSTFTEGHKVARQLLSIGGKGVPQPALGLERERFGEYFFVMGDGIVVHADHCSRRNDVVLVREGDVV